MDIHGTDTVCRCKYTHERVVRLQGKFQFEMGFTIREREREEIDTQEEEEKKKLNLKRSGYL